MPPNIESEDYYEILGLDKRASLDEVKKAYREAALKWHPDKNPMDVDEAQRVFNRISEAYQVLSDENRRRDYDRYGRADGRRVGGQDGSSGVSSRDLFPRDGFAAFGGGVFKNPDELFRDFFGASFHFGSGFDNFSFDWNIPTGAGGGATAAAGRQQQQQQQQGGGQHFSSSASSSGLSLSEYPPYFVFFFRSFFRVFLFQFYSRMFLRQKPPPGMLDAAGQKWG